MASHAKWKLLKRKSVFLSKFLDVYEDKVKLPDGSVINDYTLVRKPDSVIIVAMTRKKELIAIKEYRHAADRFLVALPSGYKNPNESAVSAAKRELLEETGYGGGRFRYIGTLYEDSAKGLNKIYVIGAKDTYLQREQSLENSETISQVKLLTAGKLNKQINSKQWTGATSLAALLLSDHLS